MERSVTVQAGERVALGFELEREALALDEIVVTGVAGQAGRREVGNTITQINLADAIDRPASLDAALQARAPGMTVMQSSGQVGSGAQIRLRGNVSVQMSNQPLIYIDGGLLSGWLDDPQLPEDRPPVATRLNRPTASAGLSPARTRHLSRRTITLKR